jgi:hypothetical protein
LKRDGVPRSDGRDTFVCLVNVSNSIQARLDDFAALATTGILCLSNMDQIAASFGC